MRARDVLPLAILAPLALFVATLMVGAPARVPAAPAPESSTPQQGFADAAVMMPVGDDVERTAAAARRSRALEATRQSGYLALLVDEGERMLTRWPDATPVPVWVAPTSSLRGWHPRMVAA